MFIALNAQIDAFSIWPIQDTLLISRFYPKANVFEYKKIQMAPGDYHISETKTIEYLKKQQIMQIDLVYSYFPLKKNLNELNKNRLLELSKYLPSVFMDEHIQWRVVLQTEVIKQGDPLSFFHGFVVYYRPYDLPSELNMINQALLGKYEHRDSTLLKVFERNPQWKNMLVVMDVTGSMYPYTAQLILWLKLNSNDGFVRHFTFFNDGDETPCSEKKIGSTGGIYHIASELYKAVAEKVIKAMQGGCGGDIQENDLEAILSGIENCPHCNDVILVADNFSPCRDLSLLKFVKKPVKIILCGVYENFHVEYLQIAYETGGSIHTIEDDILDLMTLKEGETIEIGQYKYKIVKGQFVKI